VCIEVCKRGCEEGVHTETSAKRKKTMNESTRYTSGLCSEKRGLSITDVYRRMIRASKKEGEGERERERERECVCARVYVMHEYAFRWKEPG
jgi:hypothetical protein